MRILLLASALLIAAPAMANEPAPKPILQQTRAIVVASDTVDSGSSKKSELMQLNF